MYVWADGIYVTAGLDAAQAALLVLIGALADGTQVVLAVERGQRESTASWAAVLRDLKARGLGAPKLTVADGPAPAGRVNDSRRSTGEAAMRRADGGRRGACRA